MTGDKIGGVREYPPVMPARLAAEYCGFADTSALRKARLRGQVHAGRRGGIGAFMYAKTELDRFLGVTKRER